LGKWEAVGSLGKKYVLQKEATKRAQLLIRSTIQIGCDSCLRRATSLNCKDAYRATSQPITAVTRSNDLFGICRMILSRSENFLKNVLWPFIPENTSLCV